MMKNRTKVSFNGLKKADPEARIYIAILLTLLAITASHTEVYAADNKPGVEVNLKVLKSIKGTATYYPDPVILIKPKSSKAEEKNQAEVPVAVKPELNKPLPEDIEEAKVKNIPQPVLKKVENESKPVSENKVPGLVNEQQMVAPKPEPTQEPTPESDTKLAVDESKDQDENKSKVDGLTKKTKVTEVVVPPSAPIEIKQEASEKKDPIKEKQALLNIIEEHNKKHKEQIKDENQVAASPKTPEIAPPATGKYSVPKVEGLLESKSSSEQFSFSKFFSGDKPSAQSSGSDLNALEPANNTNDVAADEDVNYDDAAEYAKFDGLKVPSILKGPQSFGSKFKLAEPGVETKDEVVKLAKLENESNNNANDHILPNADNTKTKSEVSVQSKAKQIDSDNWKAQLDERLKDENSNKKIVVKPDEDGSVFSNFKSLLGNWSQNKDDKAADVSDIQAAKPVLENDRSVTIASVDKLANKTADKQKPVLSQDSLGAVVLSLSFNGNQTTISDNDKKMLKSLAAKMNKDKDQRIKIESYASEVAGQPNSSRRIALQRAIAIRNLLIEEGMETIRINLQAMSDAKPADATKQDVTEIFLIKG